ncbi:MAG: prepilin-type N-terminal cleavage/methylation domain-containing protein, partial [Armatimonadota bacterium]
MKESKGFTITELLITIATVGILSAVLFPVFISAKEKATETTCAANLKQIGMAFNMYSQDWNGCISKRLEGMQWSLVLFDSNYVSNAQTFFCPSIPPGDKAVSSLKEIWKRPDGKSVLYADCTYGIFDSSRDEYAKTIKSKSGLSTVTMAYNKVEKPSGYIVITESSNSGKYQTYRFDRNTSAWSQIDLSRHDGTAQSLFADGHVEACNKIKLSASNLGGSGVSVWDGTG